MFHFDEVKLNRPIGQSFPLSTSVGVVEYRCQNKSPKLAI